MTANIPDPSQIPTNPAARRAWIKYQLELRGLSITKLADGARLSRKTVQKALRASYPKMEDLIARALGLTAIELWPERFDAAGQRLRRGGGKWRASPRKR